MVGAKMVKGGWRRNELGEVIQNGAENRKSRDQGRENIIKSLIIRERPFNLKVIFFMVFF
jgi:hypothetical protein